MGATLNALRELQDIELQIVDVRRQIERKARQVTETERRLAELRKTLESERQQMLAAQREADLMDLDLKARGSHVMKLRDQLNSSRTNKEYAAVLAQLNTERADAAKLEGSTLEQMERVEKLRAAVREREESEKKLEAQVENVRKQHADTGQYFSDRLAKLTAQRDELAGRLDPAIRTLFARTSERFNGEAMAKLVRVHPRRDEFCCDGCNMSVSAERYNSLRTRDDVQTCSSCGRILYIGD